MKKARTKTVIEMKATAKASAPVSVHVVINDPKYDSTLLAEDIHFKRVWFEKPAAADGWMKLVYSADGPTGDPWQIGKLKIQFDEVHLDPNFGDFSKFAVIPTTKE